MIILYQNNCAGITAYFTYVKVQGHTEIHGECIDSYVKIYYSKTYECDFLFPLTFYVICVHNLIPTAA